MYRVPIGIKGGRERERQRELDFEIYIYIYISASQTAISCFFNKRKRNVIVLFVSTFKNTTLPLILESLYEGRRGEGSRKMNRRKRNARIFRVETGMRGEGRWREYLRRY